jgi:hypothetical protein
MSVLNITNRDFSNTPRQFIRSVSGIRIVDTNLNKRASDIFNVNDGTKSTNNLSNISIRTKIIELAEKCIDDKIRSLTPHKNASSDIKYNLINHTTSMELKNFGQQPYVRKKLERRKSDGSCYTKYEHSKVEESQNGENFLNQNLKSRNFVEDKRKEKIQRQEDLTRTVTLDLISKQNNQKAQLCSKFIESKGLFDTERRKDYVLERAKQNLNRSARLDVKKKNYILNDKRLEITDYYAKNQKKIDEKNQIDEAKENQEKYFSDLKKINCMLSKSKSHADKTE